MKKINVRDTLLDGMAIVGLGMFATGIGMYSVPLMLVVVGGLLLFFAIFIARDIMQKPKHIKPRRDNVS